MTKHLVVGGFALIGVTALVVGDLDTRSAPRAATAVTSRAPAATPAAPVAGPVSQLTAAQRNAVRSAQAYLRFSGFSRQGLIDQLSSEYGDKYSVADATVAVDSVDVDWRAQAARSTATYLKMSGYSCQGLIDQLSSPHGEKYTRDQATAGALAAGGC